jgi:hypothetical protein
VPNVTPRETRVAGDASESTARPPETKNTASAPGGARACAADARALGERARARVAGLPEVTGDVAERGRPLGVMLGLLLAVLVILAGLFILVDDALAEPSTGTELPTHLRLTVLGRAS